MTALLALAAGAVLALAAGRAAGRSDVPTGVGLVLLLVAVLRALDDAVSAVGRSRLLPVLLVVGGLLAGVALRRLDRAQEQVAAGGVVLAHVGLLLSYGTARHDLPVDVSLVVDPPVPAVLLLVGLLAGGALAALRPGLVTSAVAVVALGGVLAAAELADPVLAAAAAAGLATSVLVPVLLTRAGASTGPRVVHGALVGVGLVLAVAAVPPLLEGPPQRFAGLQVLSNEAYASLLEIGFERPPLLPGLGLLRPG